MTTQNPSVLKRTLSKRTVLLFVVLILLFTPGGSLAETRLKVCWRLSNGGGQILHSSLNPGGTSVIHVVKVACGQSRYGGTIYKCSTRLVLDSPGGHDASGSGPEMGGVCDATIKWLADDRFEVTWSNGQKEEMNLMDDFGALP